MSFPLSINLRETISTLRKKFLVESEYLNKLRNQFSSEIIQQDSIQYQLLQKSTKQLQQLCKQLLEYQSFLKQKEILVILKELQSCDNILQSHECLSLCKSVETYGKSSEQSMHLLQQSYGINIQTSQSDSLQFDNLQKQLITVQKQRDDLILQNRELVKEISALNDRIDSIKSTDIQQKLEYTKLCDLFKCVQQIQDKQIPEEQYHQLKKENQGLQQQIHLSQYQLQEEQTSSHKYVLLQKENIIIKQQLKLEKRRRKISQAYISKLKDQCQKLYSECLPTSQMLDEKSLNISLQGIQLFKNEKQDQLKELPSTLRVEQQKTQKLMTKLVQTEIIENDALSQNEYQQLLIIIQELELQNTILRKELTMSLKENSRFEPETRQKSILCQTDIDVRTISNQNTMNQQSVLLSLTREDQLLEQDLQCCESRQLSWRLINLEEHDNK